MKKKLFCRYETPSEVYTLKPIKAEDAFLEPKIMVYHEFLNDQEIEHLEALAQRKVSGNIKLNDLLF